MYWENLTLLCAVSGAKPLTVLWMKDNQVIHSNEPVYLDQDTLNCLDDINCTEARLRVNSLTSKEAGDYTCTGMSNNMSVTAHINVKSKLHYCTIYQLVNLSKR